MSIQQECRGAVQNWGPNSHPSRSNRVMPAPRSILPPTTDHQPPPLDGQAVPALPCAGGHPPQRPHVAMPPCPRSPRLTRQPPGCNATVRPRCQLVANAPRADAAVGARRAPIAPSAGWHCPSQSKTTIRYPLSLDDRSCACPLPLPKPANSARNRWHEFPARLFPPQKQWQFILVRGCPLSSAVLPYAYFPRRPFWLGPATGLCWTSPIAHAPARWISQS